MEIGEIEAASRHVVRRIKMAMQGSVIRALVELITNSDDSYSKLENGSQKIIGEIQIVCRKEGHCCIYEVKDAAEGMSIDDIRKGFKKYGSATSGMKAGKNVRGYFGQGAKDALASMIDGNIISIKDNILTECKIYIEKDKAMYEIGNPINVNNEIREKYKIKNNGTIASFKADPQATGRVPQLNTIYEELGRNYILRKILMNSKRKILIIDDTANESKQLCYKFPIGKNILVEDFIINYKAYSDFLIQVSIFRADNELQQNGDDRDGGLLIVDEDDAVLGISLFRFDNEPLASRFYGEVKINSFRKLLYKEEAVLSEERDGLVQRHPFCKILISEIEKRIEIKVKEEKLLKQREEQSLLDAEESNRYKKAFNVLNEIAELEAQEVINLGDKSTDLSVEPPEGFCLYPASATITVNKKYAFEIRISKKLISQNAIIRVTSNNAKIQVITPEIRLTQEKEEKIIRKYLTIEGKEPNVNGIIKAMLKDKITESKVNVVPEKELLLDEGMVFQPDSILLRPNQARRVFLLIYTKMIESGNTVNISSDNEAIHISKNNIMVNDADAVRHVAKYELEIWGEGDGQKALITAQYESWIALLEVRIRSKEQIEDKDKKGMFNEPEFNIYDQEPLQRINYSKETGKVTIYVNFPSVKHYLGEDGKFRKTLPAQVLIADLVAETCFNEIAKKKVEVSGSVINLAAIYERIQRDSFMLSKKYGKKVHQALVDQKMLKENQK